MRSRNPARGQVAEVARRRLDLLSAELAAIRRDSTEPPSDPGSDGSGERLGPAPDRFAVPAQVPAPAAAPVAAPVAIPAAGDPSALPPGRHAQRSVGVNRSGAGWLHDRLPATLQGRIRIGAAQLCVVAAVVAVAMGLLAWWTVRAGDPGELVPTRAATRPLTSADALVTESGPSPPTAPTATGSSSAAAEVVVDVAGKVRHPGIARLPPGSRVVDALDAAGGARRGVDLRTLNLARQLVDGEQVLVGVRVPPGVAPSAAAAPTGSAGPTSLVNLNAADQAELESLPGVGPVTAQAILQWRSDHGAFSAVDELLEVSGIGDATLADIAPFVTL